MIAPTLIALMTAFAIDLWLGDPPNQFHPVVAMGSFIHWFTKKWNGGGNGRRFMLGAALILAGGALFALPWLGLTIILRWLPGWASGIILGVLLKPVFAFRGLLKAGQAVQRALAQKDLPESRRLVAWHLVSRDTSRLSERQVASATIESLAENLTDSFFAPLFFFVLGGLPAAWFYRFCNTADAMIGYHTPEYEYFGKFAARLDDILNWLPARLAGAILVLSAAVCQMNNKAAFRVMVNQHNRTSSPNAGWTMAAAAGALGIVLEKKDHYRLEGGAELPEAQDIARAMGLVKIALCFSLMVCGGIFLGIQFIF